MGIFDRRGRDADESEGEEAAAFGLGSESMQIASGITSSAQQLAPFVAPESFLVEEEHVRVGGEFQRSLFILTFPPQTNDGWLTPFYRFPEAIDISLFIRPLDSEFILTRLRAKVNKMRAQLTNDADQGNNPDYRLMRRVEDTQALIQLIEQDKTKPFQTSLVLTLRGKTLAELDRITESVERRFNVMAKTRRTDLHHKDGFLSTLPLMQNRVATRDSVKNIHTQGLVTFFPLVASDLTHESGVFYGVNQITRGSVIIDRFRQPDPVNPHMAVLGMSGSGKSYFAKAEMLQYRMLGVPAMVIDPSNEYDRLCEAVGGQFISLGVDAKDKINPLDFSHAVAPGENALREKVAAVIELLGVMLRAGQQEGSALTDYQKSIIEEALRVTYLGYGYEIRRPDTQLQATPESMPILSDLLETLDQMARKVRDPFFQQNVQPLIASLRRYCGDAAFASLFDSRTNIRLQNPFIVFNIERLAADLYPIVMQLILEFMRTTLFTVKQQRSGQQRLLYVDEAQIMMRYPETAAFLETVARTARKYNVGFCVLTQDVDVFLSHENQRIGRAIVNNCATRVLLRQAESAVDVIQDVFKLTRAEAQALMMADPGEGLVMVGNESAWVSMQDILSPLAHRLATTRAAEVAEIYRQDEPPPSLGPGR